MKINIIGNFLDNSGYSVHTRNLANALNELGMDVRLQGQLPQGWEGQVNDAELNMVQKEYDKNSTSILIGQPQFWRFALADNPKKFMGFCVWEGDKIPKFWIEYLMDERVDKIFVPSIHTKDAILNTVSKDYNLMSKRPKEHNKELELLNKIEIIPHGINPSIFYKEEVKKEDKFTFISNKGWVNGIIDRGGVQFSLKAFSEEFKESEKVRLNIKVNTAYTKPNWDLNNELNMLKLKRNSGEINVYFDSWNVKQLREFYNKGDVFVSTQMADAFNIPGIEAMGCGLPNIQTNFGGQTDYMTKDNSWFIDKGELFEVSFDYMYQGVKWFKPDIKDIQEKMRYAFDNQEEVKKKGLKALEDSKDWTWRKTGEKVIKILKE